MSRVLHLIAHDIRSAQNVGSLLRTADSIGIAKIWLTGFTPTPDHVRVAKTALGAQSVIAWEQENDLTVVLRKLKEEGFRIVGLEIAEGAVNITSYQPPEKMALLLGNEVNGIPPSLLRFCDDVVFLKQQGMKESLNVSVAAGIASFWILNAP